MWDVYTHNDINTLSTMMLCTHSNKIIEKFFVYSESDFHYQKKCSLKRKSTAAARRENSFKADTLIVGGTTRHLMSLWTLLKYAESWFIWTYAKIKRNEWQSELIIVFL